MAFRFTEQWGRTDEFGSWHPPRTLVGDLFARIGFDAVTPNVARRQVREHLEARLPTDFVDLVFSGVDLDSAEDSTFFDILHAMAGSFYGGWTRAERTKWASFVRKNCDLFPPLKRAKNNMLIISRSEQTIGVYMCALIRWYYSRSLESRRAWLGGFERLIDSEAEAEDARELVQRLIDASYRVSSKLHRHSFDRAHTLTREEVDERLAEDRMLRRFPPSTSDELVAEYWDRERTRLLADKLKTLPFVPLRQYVL